MATRKKDLLDKSIDIKGKKYAMVKDRVMWLDENKQGQYSILTDATFYAEQRMWVVKAVLKVDGQEYHGHAQETESDDYKQVNATSALENCETSAIGRACAGYGLGIHENYASGDEMKKSESRGARKATEKQINWLLSEAGNKVSDRREAESWLEDFMGKKIDEVLVYEVGDLVEKIRKQPDGEYKELDLTGNDLMDLKDPPSIDDIPY